MASILDYGAGAGEGLEVLLERLMKEKALSQRQTQLEETTRSNKASEGLRGREIEEMGSYRRSQQDMLNEERRRQNEDRDLNRVRQTLNLQPIGAAIDPATKAKQVEAGASPANFFSPILPGLSTPEGDKPEQEGESYWRGTPEQIRLEHQSNSIQDKDYTVDGKHVLGTFDPRTGHRATGAGEDITATAQPWEKPPSPDRVLIQTEGGYMPRPDATNIIRGGGQVPLPTTGTTRTMQEGAKMLAGTIPTIAEDAQALDKAGLFGPVMSRVRDMAVKMGTVQALASDDLDAQQAALISFANAIQSDPNLATDRLAGKFATELGLLASGAGRVHGGARGGGSIQMIDYLKGLLSGTSTLPMFLGRLDALGMYMNKYAGGPGGAAPKPEGGEADDIYQQYLSRTRKPGG